MLSEVLKSVSSSCRWCWIAKIRLVRLLTIMNRGGFVRGDNVTVGNRLFHLFQGMSLFEKISTISQSSF